jgi:hypothetical protein
MHEEPWRQAGSEDIDIEIRTQEVKLERMRERGTKLKAKAQTPGADKGKAK